MGKWSLLSIESAIELIRGSLSGFGVSNLFDDKGKCEEGDILELSNPIGDFENEDSGFPKKRRRALSRFSSAVTNDDDGGYESILDDPTDNLDMLSKDSMQEAISEIGSLLGAINEKAKKVTNNNAVSNSSEIMNDSELKVRDLVVTAMTPYLSRWMNENLPSIVRSVVEKELKKLVPKS